MPPKIFVIADSEKLQQVIEINLRDHWEVLRYNLAEANRPPTPDLMSSVSLILFALSAAQNEPLVWLARTGLQNYLGGIPLLIISDRDFKSAPAQKIYHLNFSFSAEELQHHVATILFRTAAVLVE